MRKSRQLPALTLVAAISTLLCVSTFCLLAFHGEYNARKLWLNLIVNFPLCLGLTYFDYKAIALLKKKLSHGGSVESVLCDFTLTTLTVCAVSLAVNAALGTITLHKFEVVRLMLSSILLNSIIVLILELHFYDKQQAEHENRINLMEKEYAMYKFEALKNQINPHFLFNSLNVLSSLAYQDATKANRFAKKLSNVYRYLLTTHDKYTVSLNEEMQFVDSYLYLLHIRFGNALRTNISDYTTYADRQVIPAGIQMLVENALKHNACTTTYPLDITININETGIRVSNNIMLRDYVAHTGKGLDNLRKQYGLHGKNIEATQHNGTFEVFLPFV